MSNIVDDYNPTNGDRIREKIDSELAEIIKCPYDTEPDMCNRKGCYECCMERIIVII